MKKTGCIVLLMLFVTTCGFAQENGLIRISRTFELHSRNAQQEQEIQHGVYYGTMKAYYAAVIKTFNINDLDTYRFLNTRRTIDFADSDVYIVLYSAQELHDNFGKTINKVQQEKADRKVAFQADLEHHIVTIQITE